VETAGWEAANFYGRGTAISLQSGEKEKGEFFDLILSFLKNLLDIDIDKGNKLLHDEKHREILSSNSLI
jgi:hypothetical protein